LSETFTILTATELDIIITVRCSSCDVTVILVRFQRNFNFLDRFSKNSNYKFNENPPAEAELFYAGGRTDREIYMRKLIISTTNNKICYLSL